MVQGRAVEPTEKTKRYEAKPVPMWQDGFQHTHLYAFLEFVFFVKKILAHRKKENDQHTRIGL